MKQKIGSDYFMFKDFKNALNNLDFALNQKSPFALILGDSGVGKTSLLKHFSNSIDKSKFQIIYLSGHSPTPYAFVRFLAHSLHLPIRASMIDASALIIQTLQMIPYHLIIFIDEAHTFNTQTLLEIKQISESAFLSKQNLFTVVFSALPSFKQKLLSPDLYPLWRRCFPKINITGLIHEELKTFLDFYYNKALTVKISDEALSVIFEHSKGIPGIILSFINDLLLEYPDGNISKNIVSEFISTNEI